MARHKPGSIWSFRRPSGVFDSYVRTANPMAVEMVLVQTLPIEVVKDGIPYTVIRMPRREARLLARRLLQCLEDTK